MIRKTAKVLATIVAAPLILVSVSGEAMAHTYKVPNRHKQSQPVMYEDDPRWDCRVHGNRICGVTTNGVHYLIKHNRKGFPVHVTVYGPVNKTH